jgi:hypothetical protein
MAEVNGYTFDVAFRLGINATDEKEARKKIAGIVSMLGQDYPIARVRTSLSKND